MNKKRLRVAKKSPMFEKKVIFGIRKFTVGVASVGIATAFLISGTGQLV
ncbi:TPA: YSIRK-type signal peptide-containing protein [Streptococcus suis]